MSGRRIQGGSAGLIAALLAGRVCPISGEVVRRGRRWRDSRRNWYAAAKAERVAYHDRQKAERWEMGRLALAIPDLLAQAPPF